MDGQRIIMYNYFYVTDWNSFNKCHYEQYQLYIPPTWTEAKANAWYSCIANTQNSQGEWRMQAIDEATGKCCEKNNTFEMTLLI